MHITLLSNKNAETVLAVSAFYLKDLAATYSRASYTGTTIGKTVFDGRVRNGIGSDHSFMTTKSVGNHSETREGFLAPLPASEQLRNLKEQDVP